jgi:putative methyltransferase (TIGR04325 family)
MRYRDALLFETLSKPDAASLTLLSGLSLALRGGTFNVLDFGGGCGAHYFFTKAFFPGVTQITWHVVETSAMVGAARGIETDRLRFFDRIEQAAADLGGIDLVLSSGALQYAPDPANILSKLTSLNAKAVFFTRVALSRSSDEPISIHETVLGANGPGPKPEHIADAKVRYPVTFLSKRRFERILGRAYSRQMSFTEERDVYLAGKQSIDLYCYFGYLSSSTIAGVAPFDQTPGSFATHNALLPHD